MSRQEGCPTARRGLVGTLARLRQMTLREICFRGRAAATVTLERAMVWGGVSPTGRLPVRKVGAPPGTVFFFDPDRRSEMVHHLSLHHPAWVQRATERAEAVCHDAWFCNPRWGAERARDVEWPKVFYADINLFAGDRGHGDIRALWEVNRHAALVDLAKAHYLTGAGVYRRRCLELLQSWLQQNPYGLGVNWTSALEVAMRVLGWVWVHFFLGGQSGLQPEEREQLLAALHQHGVYLERHLSVYFSPNNHLIGEATALYTLGSAFPELPRAEQWKRQGWEILAREVAFQFHEDGGSIEQAACYHHFTLGLYLQATILRRLQGQEIDPAVWSRLERALWFTLYLTRPDGRIPMIGDNDDAVACPAAERKAWDFRHYLAVGATLFGVPEFRWAAGEFSELAYWLLGEAGWERYNALPARPPGQPSTALRASGYCIMRSGWDPTSHYLCLDCGSLASGAQSDGTVANAHAHADALGLEVSVFGKPMIVDPGTYTYNGDPEWHRYFRETLAHNTLVVDGLSQSEFGGRLRWRHGAETRLEVWESLDAFDYAQASHNGYERSNGAVRHRRGVFFARSWGWIIWDRLEGTGVHRVDAYLHFDPGVTLAPLEAGLLARNGQVGLAIKVTGPSEIETHVVCGQEGSAGGWVAPAYGQRKPAPVARFTLSTGTPATIWQVFSPSLNPDPSLSLGRRQGEAADALLVESSGRSDLLLLSHRPSTSVTIGGLTTDAHLVWLSRESVSGPVRGALLGGSYVSWHKKYLWRASSPMKKASFTGRVPHDSLDPAEAAG